MQTKTSCGGSVEIAQAVAAIEEALEQVSGEHMKLSTLTVTLARRVADLAGPLPVERRQKLIDGVHTVLARNIVDAIDDAGRLQPLEGGRVAS